MAEITPKLPQQDSFDPTAELRENGDLDPERDFFIQRSIDDRFPDLLRTTPLIFLFGPRQSGKSSLAGRMVTQFAREGWTSGMVFSLPSRGEGQDMGEWFLSLASAIADALDLIQLPKDWWVSREADSPMTVFEVFLCEWLPNNVPGRQRITLFIDEVDSIAEDQELTRFFYNALRSAARRMQKLFPPPLSLCLIGATPPGYLLTSPLTTPMNIGHTEIMEDFSWEEFQQYALILSGSMVGSRVPLFLKAVFDQTSGQPHLSQLWINKLRADPDLIQCPESPEVFTEVVNDRVKEWLDGPSFWAQTHFKHMVERLRASEPLAMSNDKLRLLLDVVSKRWVPFDGIHPTHLVLNLSGAVKVIQGGDGRPFLCLRNAIYQKVLSRSRVEEWLSVDADRVKTNPAIWDTFREVRIPTLVRNFVRKRILTTPSPGNDRDQKYKIPQNREGYPFLGETIFHFPLINKETQEPVLLKVFHGLSGLAGHLWERTIRILIMLSNEGAVSLPEILEASYDKNHDIAYAITLSSPVTLNDSRWIEYLRKDPEEAVRHLQSLVEGLAVLHVRGIVHGAIWPEFVEVIDDGNGHIQKLQFAGFEFSGLVSNLLVPTPVGVRDEISEMVRRDLLMRGSHVLAYRSPEELRYMAEPRGNTGNVGAASDMFSFGVLAYTLLVGPLPLKDECRFFASSEQGPQWREEHYRQFFMDLEQGIKSKRQSRELAKLPLVKAFLELLENLLSKNWRNRPTANDVHELFKGWFKRWPPVPIYARGASGRHLLSCDLAMIGNKLSDFKLISGDPKVNEGRKQALRFLKTDLEGARMVYAPEGCTRLASGESAAHARYVLVTERMVYFSRVLDVDGNPEFRVLHITYIFERGYAFAYFSEQVVRMPLPPFELIPRTQVTTASDTVVGRPDWRPFLSELESVRLTPDQRQLLDSLKWMLHISRAYQNCRIYGCNLQPTGETFKFRLQRDGRLDNSWTHDDSLRHIIATMENGRYRPSLGQLLQDEESRGNAAIMIYAADQGTDPTQGDLRFIGRVQFSRWESMESVLVEDSEERVSKAEFFGHCWMMLEKDRGYLATNRSIESALLHLHYRPALLNQLIHPDSPHQIWRRNIAQACAGLADEGPKVIEQMVTTHPFFLLQGPPGTGKTTVASRAILAELAQDPMVRILVSAQSHHALDNLAERILKIIEESDGHGVSSHEMTGLSHALGDGVVGSVALRRYGARASARSVESDMQKWRTDAVVDRLLKRLEGLTDVKERAASIDGSTPALEGVMRDWLKTAPQIKGELRARLRASVNLVFVTAGGSNEQILGSPDLNERFDWVVVDEAAKAMPTELILPMIHGNRWALIGDSRQLPAFELQMYKSFQRAMHVSKKSIQGKDAFDDDAFTRYLRLFSSLETSTMENAPADSEYLFQGPCSTLVSQYRMASQIGDMVSRCFYSGRLHHRKRMEPDPRIVLWGNGEPLVWIDTLAYPDRCEGKGQSRNRNELERKLVQVLAADLEKAFGTEDINSDRLAFLSPYKSQTDELRRNLPERFTSCVHTVDSFQGREADVVIVSLVRSNNEATDIGKVGFMIAPERVNVMFSRAREQLIVIGDFEHFKDIGLARAREATMDAVAMADVRDCEGSVENVLEEDKPFWPCICDTFAEHRLHAATVLAQCSQLVTP